MRLAPAAAKRRARATGSPARSTTCVVVSALEADGALAEHVDGGDHLDRELEPLG